MKIIIHYFLLFVALVATTGCDKDDNYYPAPEFEGDPIIRKSKCSTDFKRNDFLKKNEAYPLGALRSLKFAYRKLRISLFVELAV